MSQPEKVASLDDTDQRPEETPSFLPWRIRDAGEDIVELRRALVPGSRSFSEEDLIKYDQAAISDAIARIRSEKLVEVQRAFEHAASTVIKSLRSPSPGEKEGEFDEETLPPVIQHIKELELLRDQSMDRSFDNREYAKRKGAKTEANLVAERAKAVKGPKFTRNTPASSAAALDSRLGSARAILCVAGHIAFNKLTPSFDDESDRGGLESKHDYSDISMGAAGTDGETMGQRVVSAAASAAKRSALRYRRRKENILADRRTGRRKVSTMPSPFSWRDAGGHNFFSFARDNEIEYKPNSNAITKSWLDACRPRMHKILGTGLGHIVYHDLEWPSRHGRIADFLRSLTSQDNYGLHLIVATKPDVKLFAQEFRDCREAFPFLPEKCEELKALTYLETSEEGRRKLRQFFPLANGLSDSLFHVLITSYETFFQDYIHFCQLPFEVTVLDDSAGWMSAARIDSNSSLGYIWNHALWSRSDGHTGLAGTNFSDWDFSKDDFDEGVIKEAWVGLTTKHRVMTASSTRLEGKHSTEQLSTSGLVSFVAPNFADIVQEDWERSRINTDTQSMGRFQDFVARSLVVHSSSSSLCLRELAIKALRGELLTPDLSAQSDVPSIHSDDEFVSAGKIAISKRSALAWLGSSRNSWLRYELGVAKLQSILDYLKISTQHGHLCEEVITASSTTTTGATGQVIGSMAYFLAVRCCRHFGSEQGLRQHMAALHSPSGTWLCRTCGSDCIYSQARTYHERSCGQPLGGVAVDGKEVGATPTVGQGVPRKVGNGRKRNSRKSIAPNPPGEKNSDGSIRVAGYRGVWVDKKGKYFVKIDERRLKDSSSKLIVFKDADSAARRYDEVMKNVMESDEPLNFFEDGSRNVFDDTPPPSRGLEGAACASVVPALSKINIDNLPADVKPLLRDPRQTSRTGGNSKRHVYAYRGVCRQARKGHDRWQSQISFMGVNHYLGTYDSEWDAAAIYAWAHLVLYGEDATRQAQKEGEEAAAAYEQEKKDGVSGKLPLIQTPTGKTSEDEVPDDDSNNLDNGSVDENGFVDTELAENQSGMLKEKETDSLPEKNLKLSASPEEVPKLESGKKRKLPQKQTTPTTRKRSKLSTKGSKIQNVPIGPTLVKGVSRALILGHSQELVSEPDAQLAREAGVTVKWKKKAFSRETLFDLVEHLKPSVEAPGSVDQEFEAWAFLLGLRASMFEWDAMSVLNRSGLRSQDLDVARQKLAVEYDDGGLNDRFRSCMLGWVCIIGLASPETENSYEALGLGSPPLGGTIGMIDCHIGGAAGSCGENAACIRFDGYIYQILCLAAHEIVSVNGKRLFPENGFVELNDGDICSVGCRVFLFCSRL